MEPLDYTDNGDTTVTLNNDPPPEAISIPRVPWENMVNGVYPWAVVTEVPNDDPENPNPDQFLTITATNASAEFRRTGNGPGRTTYLDTVTWA